MSIEIERKFLLADDSWRGEISTSTRMAQGYLVGAAALAAGMARASTRVRVAGERAWLNVKAAKPGVERLEFEYSVPLEDADILLRALCVGQLEKVRHLVPMDGHTFEIDEFSGVNAGLVVAEIELPAADAPFPHPLWLGREVSHLKRYYNVNLVDHPFRDWPAAERAGDDD